jgi:hypothetical protein
VPCHFGRWPSQGIADGARYLPGNADGAISAFPSHHDLTARGPAATGQHQPLEIPWR